MPGNGYLCIFDIQGNHSTLRATWPHRGLPFPLLHQFRGSQRSESPRPSLSSPPPPGSCDLDRSGGRQGPSQPHLQPRGCSGTRSGPYFTEQQPRLREAGWLGRVTQRLLSHPMSKPCVFMLPSLAPLSDSLQIPGYLGPAWLPGSQSTLTSSFALSTSHPPSPGPHPFFFQRP